MAQSPQFRQSCAVVRGVPIGRRFQGQHDRYFATKPLIRSIRKLVLSEVSRDVPSAASAPHHRAGKRIAMKNHWLALMIVPATWLASAQAGGAPTDRAAIPPLPLITKGR